LRLQMVSLLDVGMNIQHERISVKKDECVAVQPLATPGGCPLTRDIGPGSKAKVSAADGAILTPCA
jgi:hypothetical protein